LVLALGCQRYEKIVNYNPPLANVPGVQFGTKPVHGQGTIAPVLAVPTQIVIENPDGSRTLIARTAGHLMAHIKRTLAEDARDEFTEQVLSEATRNEYISRGLDPGQAFDTLKAHERDVLRFFSRMPMGEHSPNVIMSKIGERTYRVKITGQGASDLRWHMMDMHFEKGNWRLLWFG
jgi:hypothetical protein